MNMKKEPLKYTAYQYGGKIPRTWKAIEGTTESDYKLLEQWIKVCNVARKLRYINYIPRLYFFHSTRSWGLCSRERKTDNSIIAINDCFKDKPTSACLETMIHEVSHAGGYIQDGHNADWKRRANTIAQLLGYNHDFTRLSTSDAHEGIKLPQKVSHYGQTYKYKVICDKCGKEYTYKKTSTVVKLIMKGEGSKCTCPKCKGHQFSLESNLLRWRGFNIDL